MDAKLMCLDSFSTRYHHLHYPAIIARLEAIAAAKGDRRSYLWVSEPFVLSPVYADVLFSLINTVSFLVQRYSAEYQGSLNIYSRKNHEVFLI
jgi:hypothetical protein